MSFHPDKNLPYCMMPDGGECCAGHVALCEDWHRQRREIEGFRSAAQRQSDRGDLTKLAAECHRAKWEFDLSSEGQPPSKSELRELANNTFRALHRIGDMALKLRDASSVPSTDREGGK